MNFSVLQKILSFVFLSQAIALFFCMIGGIFLGESLDSAPQKGFLFTIILALIISGGMNIASKRNKNNSFFRREALCAIGSTWLSTSILGAIPFYLGIADISLVNCIFESTSGFTATGATIFNSFDNLSASLFLWRSLSQWIGGLGVIVFFVAILSSMGAGAKILFSHETSASASDLNQERIQDGILKLLIFYLILTLSCLFSYKIFGMSWFDAINHSMTTIATGGFSTHIESFQYFNNPSIEWVAVLFMTISASTFIFIIGCMEGQKGIFRKGMEIYFFYLIIIMASFFLFFILKDDLPSMGALRTAFFQAVSLISTTGFSSADYDAWGMPSKILLMILMFIGGCSGSTSGGLKVVRVVISIKTILKTITQMYRPNKTVIMHLGSKKINDNFIRNILVYVLFVFAIQFISIFVLSLIENSLNFTSLFSIVQSTLFNIGPGFDAIGPSNSYNSMQNSTKLILSFLMILGRLEIYALVVLFLPSIWKRYS